MQGITYPYHGEKVGGELKRGEASPTKPIPLSLIRRGGYRG
jgi:hypothetical protein